LLPKGEEKSPRLKKKGVFFSLLKGAVIHAVAGSGQRMGRGKERARRTPRKVKKGAPAALKKKEAFFQRNERILDVTKKGGVTRVARKTS